MSKPLPGIQRIELQEAGAALKNLSARLDKHRRECRTCARSGVDRAKYCQEGWDLVKAEWAARKRYRLARHAQIPGEQTLF